MLRGSLLALVAGLCLLGGAVGALQGRAAEAQAADAKYAAEPVNGSNATNGSAANSSRSRFEQLMRSNMTGEQENCNETNKCHMVCGKGVRYTEDNATFFCGKIQDVPGNRMYPRGPVNPFFCGKVDFSADPPPPPLEEEDTEDGYRPPALVPAKNESNATLNGTNGTNGTRAVNVTVKKGNETVVVTKQVNESKTRPAPVGNASGPAADGNATGNATGNASNATAANGTVGEETVESINRRQAAKERNESAVNDTKNASLLNGTKDEDKQERDPDDLLEDRPREDCIRWKSGECAEWKSDAVEPIEVKNQSTPEPKKPKVTKAEKAKRKKWSQTQECHRVCRPEQPPPPPPPPPPPAPVKMVNDMLCAARANCSTCVSKKLFPLSEFPQPCGWCEDTQSCLAGGPDGPIVNKNFTFEGNCSNWQPDFCQGESCASIGKTGGCAACTTNPFCGYCKTTKSCVEGDIDGPMLGTCPQWNSEFCEFEDLEEEKAAVSKVLFKTLTGNCPKGTLFINGTCKSIAVANATSNATNVTVKAPVVVTGMDKLKGYLSGKKARKMFVKQINEDNTTEAKLLTVSKDGSGVETTEVVDGTNITHLNALDPAVRAENRARKANATKGAGKQINVTDMPKPELTNHPNQTVVSEFKVNINMTLISGPNNTAHRHDMEADFKEDIAEATNCRASRIKVLDIRSGIIQYAVLPAKNWTGTQTPLEVATKVRVLLKNRKSKIYKGTVTSKVDPKFYPTITPREVPCDAEEDKLSHGDKVTKKTDKHGNEMLHITLKDGTVVEAQDWGVAVAPSEEGVKKQRCRKAAAKAKGEALANAAANGAASMLEEEMLEDC